MEQSRLVQGMIGRASREHPSRKDLTPTESKLCRKIASTLDGAWSKEKLTVEQIDFLAGQEY
jgi:hypothetical protein